jgi:hypothetical protein
VASHTHEPKPQPHNPCQHRSHTTFEEPQARHTRTHTRHHRARSCGPKVTPVPTSLGGLGLFFPANLHHSASGVVRSRVGQQRRRRTVRAAASHGCSQEGPCRREWRVLLNSRVLVFDVCQCASVASPNPPRERVVHVNEHISCSPVLHASLQVCARDWLPTTDARVVFRRSSRTQHVFCFLFLVFLRLSAFCMHLELS